MEQKINEDMEKRPIVGIIVISMTIIIAITGLYILTTSSPETPTTCDYQCPIHVDVPQIIKSTKTRYDNTTQTFLIYTDTIQNNYSVDRRCLTVEDGEAYLSINFYQNLTRDGITPIVTWGCKQHGESVGDVMLKAGEPIAQ